MLVVSARPGRDTDLTIQVPVKTSLKLSCINGGDIVVEGVSGEIEVNNTNGGVKLTNVSGSVIAHALNKSVIVKLNKITPDKSMSFSSLNGDVDVTLPADAKARVKIKTDNGEIYTDFDVNMDASGRQPFDHPFVLRSPRVGPDVGDGGRQPFEPLPADPDRLGRLGDFR